MLFDSKYRLTDAQASSALTIFIFDFFAYMFMYSNHVPCGY